MLLTTVRYRCQDYGKRGSLADYLTGTDDYIYEASAGALVKERRPSDDDIGKVMQGQIGARDVE